MLRADHVFAAERDAGPLVQSSLIVAMLSVTDPSNIFASNDAETALPYVLPLSKDQPIGAPPPPPPLSSSSPQKNLPVAESQPRALLSASQSTIVIPVSESIREKADIEAVLDTSKF